MNMIPSSPIYLQNKSNRRPLNERKTQRCVFLDQHFFGQKAEKGQPSPVVILLPTGVLQGLRSHWFYENYKREYAQDHAQAPYENDY